MQQAIIQEFGVKPAIDVDAEIKRRVEFLKKMMIESRTNGLLIAISGGVDSAVTAALCQLATDELTKEQGKEYITMGVFLPFGDQEDIDDSYAAARALNLKHTVEMNIEDAVSEVVLESEYALKSLGIHRHLSRAGKGNVKARVRMVMQYALAYEQNLLVVGTDHASEAVVGFFTKYGDGAVDALPLASLNKRQVRMLAEKLGVPRQIIDKVPTAGLWPGQTDEDELGMTYDDNCDYLEGKPVDPAIRQKLEDYYKRTQHKRLPIPRI